MVLSEPGRVRVRVRVRGGMCCGVVLVVPAAAETGLRGDTGAGRDWRADAELADADVFVRLPAVVPDAVEGAVGGAGPDLADAGAFVRPPTAYAVRDDAAADIFGAAACAGDGVSVRAAVVLALRTAAVGGRVGVTVGVLSDDDRLRRTLPAPGTAGTDSTAAAPDLGLEGATAPRMRFGCGGNVAAAAATAGAPERLALRPAVVGVLVVFVVRGADDRLRSTRCGTRSAST